MPESNAFLYFKNPLDRFLGEKSYLYIFLRQRLLSTKYNLGLEGAAQREDKKYVLSPLAINQFKLNVQLFVDCARNVGTEPILITEGRIIKYGMKERDFKRLRHANKIMPIDFALEAFIKTDEIIKSVAQEKRVQLIDAASLLVETDKTEKPLYIDHVHLSDSGSRELAKIVKEKLKELIFAKTWE